MDARLDEMRGDDRRRAADAAGGVDAHDRLAGRAERVGEVQLRHHHALEHVGRLADDDGVDVARRSGAASSSARCAASRTRPAMETSGRFDAYFVWPTPMTATRLLMRHRRGPWLKPGTVSARTEAGN